MRGAATAVVVLADPSAATAQPTGADRRAHPTRNPTAAEPTTAALMAAAGAGGAVGAGGAAGAAGAFQLAGAEVPTVGVARLEAGFAKSSPPSVHLVLLLI